MIRPSSQIRPRQRSSERHSARARAPSSTVIRGSSAASAESWRTTRRPVALPPAWTTRLTEWPPSRPSARRPKRSASKRTPSACRSRTQSGASRTRISAAECLTRRARRARCRSGAARSCRRRRGRRRGRPGPSSWRSGPGAWPRRARPWRARARRRARRRARPRPRPPLRRRPCGRPPGRRRASREPYLPRGAALASAYSLHRRAASPPNPSRLILPGVCDSVREAVLFRPGSASGTSP